MKAEGFTSIDSPTLHYDPERCGFWVGDNTGPVVFLPRSIVIEMVGVLTSKGETE